MTDTPTDDEQRAAEQIAALRITEEQLRAAAERSRLIDRTAQLEHEEECPFHTKESP